MMDRLARRSAAAAALLVAWGAASAAQAEITYTNALGGPGGAPFEDSCTPGDFLVGVNYDADKALNTIAPVCMAEKQGAWVGGEYVRHTWGKFGEGHGTGGSFGAAGSPRCPVNQYVTALHVWWDKFGIVHHVKVFCHDVTRAQKATFTTNTGGGEPNHSGSAPCPRGLFGIGLIGGSGALIDRVGLKCQGLAPP